MLHCLNASVRQYGKGEYEFRQGEYIRSLMILAAGRLHIQKEDYWGNLNILNEIRPGEMFGEAYIAPNSGPLMNPCSKNQLYVPAFHKRKTAVLPFRRGEAAKHQFLLHSL